MQNRYTIEASPGLEPLARNVGESGRTTGAPPDLSFIQRTTKVHIA